MTLSAENPTNNILPDSTSENNTPDWYNHLSEQDVAYVKEKNWDTWQAAIQACQTQEQQLKQSVLIPQTEDTKAWEELYQQLGRPSEATKYELQFADHLQASPETESWFKQTAFAAGLVPKQAQVFLDQWTQWQVTQQEAKQAESQTHMEHLKQEWGVQFDRNLEQAKRAIHFYQVPEMAASALEHAMGTKDMLLFLHKLGESIKEPQFIRTATSPVIGEDHAGARSQLQNLMADKLFMADYLSGNPVHVQKIKALMQSVHGTKH